jgi:hypothetical protein
MERSFIATKESKYVQELNKYIELTKQQREFVKKFCSEKEIEANCYIVSGNGCMNVPFSEYSKNDICFSIEATENDLIKFGKMLCKIDDNGLNKFKKSSSIAKEFAQMCVDEKVVINLWSPRVSDYFESLGCYGCSYSQFPVGDDLYIKVSSEYLKDDDIIEGFTEIKTSDFYIAKEKFESEKVK